ncbi:MAG: CDP-alcohol phosphatidyltransferase family protein [Alphaproteobacteria bacterium]
MNHLPNILSLSRIAAIPLLAAFVLWNAPAAGWLAAVVFTAAALTDFLDGWIARHHRLSSDFGRLIDPIADKLLVIVLREGLVSGLREHLAGLGARLPVTRLAKWKTAAQMTAIVLLLTGWAPVAVPGEALLWLAAVLTCVTGWDYVRRGLAEVAAAGGTDRADAES